MSASEKLRELDGLIHVGTDEQGIPAEDGVFGALPLIADVVEAAEDAADHFIDQSAHDHGWPIELKAALAALDEALTKTVLTASDPKA